MSALLDLQDKETIVSLLMAVQMGKVSCRRAATEIQKCLPNPHLSKIQRKEVRKMKADGYTVKKICSVFNIHASTVWRICKSDV